MLSRNISGERSDPFSYTKRFLKQDLEDRSHKPNPDVFRFDQWESILKHMHSHCKPIAEFMIRTGMIASEIAGLKSDAIHKDYILVQNSIVRSSSHVEGLETDADKIREYFRYDFR